MKGLRFSFLNLLLLILLALAVLAGPAVLEAQECVTPLGWQPKLGSHWNRDANGNNVEDDIEAMAPGEILNVLLDLNDCATPSDLGRFAAAGTVGYIGRSVSVVQLLGVTAAEAEALGDDPRVAMVEIDREVTAQLDLSNPAIRVRASGTYSPDTVEDRFPGVDGTGINIAVLDTGADDGQHESLPAARFVGGYNAFTGVEGNPNDDHGHGTHVAGIALGSGGGAGTLRGVAPGAGLVDVKVLDAAGRGSFAVVIAGIDWVIRKREALHIRVMSLSLSGSVPSNGMDATSQAINRAVQSGIVAVIAASNFGPANLIPAPGAADDAVTVAASSDQGTVFRGDDLIATFSSRGPRLSDGDGDTADELKPDVTAPGVTIHSAQANTVNGYINLNGTSMAAPHVAGLAALILQRDPGLRPLAVKQRLLDTAEDFGPVGWDVAWGMGLVNGLTAVNGEVCSRTDLAITFLAPRNPFIVQGVPNALRATVCNQGPAVANAVPVRFGTYFFGNSVAYSPICTASVPTDLAPGRCSTVECPWVPELAGHVCAKAEIVNPCDLDPSDDFAQRNLEIRQSHSPAEFRMQVVNPTGEDLDVEVLADFGPYCGGWNFFQSENEFELGAAVCPVFVDFALTPLAGTTASCRVGVRVEGVRTNGTRVALGGVSLLGSVPETVRPFCSVPVIGTDASGRRTLTVTIQDSGSGVAQINVLRQDNLDAPVPAFLEGTRDVITFTAAKHVNGQAGVLELEIYDAAKNVTLCDPVLLDVDRGTGKPVTHRLTGIPAAEHRVTVTNGNPGISSLRLEVNGRKFQMGGLAPGEIREIDIASALLPGNDNVVLVTALGQPGGEAAVLIHE